jgi:hypothetical protein
MSKPVVQSKSGKRVDLDNMFIRSKWEANYARYLNFLVKCKSIEKWDYEKVEFEFPVKRGNRFYKVDFRVFNLDGTVEFHEVKGYMDASSKTKLKRMAKYYPNINLKVIDKVWFKANTHNLKRLIPYWE